MSGVDSRFEAVNLYINALFKRSIYTYPIPITFVSSVVLEIAILIFLSKKDFQNSLMFGLTCIAGTLGYALMMFILYAFCYPEREALVLISYERYMSSMLGALILSIVLLYIYNFNNVVEKFSIKKSSVACLLIIALLDSNRLLNFVPQIILGNRFTAYEELAEKVKKDINPGESLYILYDHDIADSYPAFTAYYLDEIFVCKVNTDFNENEYANSKELNRAIEELKQYDYVYVVEASDTFNSYFSKYNNDNDFAKETLYKVTDKDVIYFEKVN